MNEKRMALLSLVEFKETLERVQRLKALCARAADVLANVLPCSSGGSKITILSLIAELRKAAE